MARQIGCSPALIRSTAAGRTVPAVDRALALVAATGGAVTLAELLADLPARAVPARAVPTCARCAARDAAEAERAWDGDPTAAP